jgi:hypothetical protein
MKLFGLGLGLGTKLFPHSHTDFKNISGYEDLKEIIKRALDSELLPKNGQRIQTLQGLRRNELSRTALHDCVFQNSQNLLKLEIRFIVIILSPNVASTFDQQPIEI